MEALQSTLYQLSTALLFPTVFVLLLMTAWTVMLMGGFFREWTERTSQRKALNHALAAMKSSPPDREQAWNALKQADSGLTSRLCKELSGWPADELTRNKILEDLELGMARSLTTLSFIARIAPMLGLMGTLIPLGPALTGLATGNIKALAGNLVVAFTTTVVGILVGGCAFAMSLVRKNWYNQDLSDIEFLCQKATGQESHNA